METPTQSDPAAPTAARWPGVAPRRWLGLTLALVGSACASPGSLAGSGSGAEAPPAVFPEGSAASAGTGRAPGAFYGAEPAAQPTRLEGEVFDAVRAAHGGCEHLRTSASLTLAARDLARRALRQETPPTGGPQLRAALAAALSFDPAPAVFLIGASQERDLPATAARAVTPGPATRIGVGIASREGVAYAVVLLAHRLAALRPFPRDVPLGGRAALRGDLAGLTSPRVFVTLPSGEAIEVANGHGRSFEVDLSFAHAGRYLVEVIGTGPGGPEVAALLAVACGGASLAAPALVEPVGEPDSIAIAEEQVLAAIQEARARLHLPPLRASRSIGKVARQHSERMSQAGRLAHWLPGSGDAGERLRSAQVPYQRVLENVALGPTSLAAHQIAEESPAHLKNILDPMVTEVGCGIAHGALPGGGPGVYLTEIFVEPPEPDAEGRFAPEELVRAALWRARARLAQPPLLVDPQLDELARSAVRAMLRRGEPSDPGLGRRALALGRKVSAADVFVAASPDEASRSPNLKDAGFRRVGVGVALGDSTRFGAGRLWIAVVYTD